MIYKNDFLQQFRDADESGRLSARGYLNYFQNEASVLMHNMRRGNDTLPYEFRIAWLYTKYRLENIRPAGFDVPLHAETWISSKGPVKLNTDYELTRNGELICCGRLESCLYHVDKKQLQPIKAVSLPEDAVEDRRTRVGAFSRPSVDSSIMDKAYEYTVRYADLDNNRHMTNLSYGPLFINAFGPELYADHYIKTFEIHYLNQSYYGESLSVLFHLEESRAELYALKADGTKAAWCLMEFGFSDQL